MTVPDLDSLFDAQEKINTKTTSSRPNGLKPLRGEDADRLTAMLRDAEDTIVIEAEVVNNGHEA